MPVEGYCLIECGGDLCDEIGTFLILNVLRRAVSQHLKRRLKGGVHCHLMNTCALTHRVIVVAKEVILHGVDHRTRCVIHRTCKHTQIGCCHIVAGLVVERTVAYTRFPLGVLESFHTFEIKDIRISPLNTKGFQSMEVKVEMMASCTGCHLIGRGNHLLIVTIEEIHLKAFTFIDNDVFDLIPGGKVYII